ncbi:hypothetical protein Tco_1469135, partial [Tanacetum coccineum]
VQDRLSGEIPPVENTAVTEVVPELDLGREVAAMGPHVNKKHRKRGNDEADANASPKVLRKDHAASRPTQSNLGGKSLASIGLEAGSTFFVPALQETPADVSDPDPLSYAKPQLIHEQDIAQSSKGAAIAGDPDSKKSSSFTSMDMVDHIVPPGLLKKATAKIAKRDQRIQAREEEIKKLDQEIKSLWAVDTKVQGLRNQTRNLETLLKAEFTDLQVSNDVLSQQVSTLQAQVTGEERIKAAFEEFKKYEDDLVNFRCAEMDARLDAMNIDFDEKLYPHMLTVIVGRLWMIGHSLRLAIMKCAESIELRQVFADVVSAGIAKGMSEGLKHVVEHGKAKLDLEAIEAYDPEADTKYVVALHALKDLKYPIVDQLEKLKDAPIDVIMASLYLESDSGEDTPQWIRELRPSSSQLKIPVYPEVSHPQNRTAAE